MDLEESEKIANIIMQELHGNFSTPVTVNIPYNYAEKIIDDEDLRDIEISLLKLYEERKSGVVKRVNLHRERRDKALIEVTLKI